MKKDDHRPRMYRFLRLPTLLALVAPAFSAGFLITQALWPHLHFRQPYDDFVFGDLILTAESKTNDFAAFYLLLAAFAAVYSAFAAFLRVLTRRASHARTQSQMTSLLRCASIPAALWLLAHFFEPTVPDALLFASLAGAAANMLLLTKEAFSRNRFAQIKKINAYFLAALIAVQLTSVCIAHFFGDSYSRWTQAVSYLTTCLTAAFLGLLGLLFLRPLTTLGKTRMPARQRNGEQGPRISFVFALSGIPAGAWAAGHFLVKEVSPGFLYYSAVALSVNALFWFFLKHRAIPYDRRMKNLLIASHFVVIILVCDMLGLVTAVTRIFPSTTVILQAKIFLIEMAGVFFSILLLLHLWYRRASLDLTEKKASTTLLVLQAWLPLLSFVLIPPAWIAGSGYVRPFGDTTTLAVSLGVLGAFALIPVVLQWRKMNAGPSSFDPIKALVPTSLGFIIVFLVVRTFTDTSISEDNYHFGETIISWHQFAQFGKLPYASVNVTHGLFEFIRGFISSVFFDSSPNSIVAANSILVGGLLFPAFLLGSRLIGVIPAFFLFPFLTPVNLHFYLPVIIFFLTLAQPELLRSSFAWLLTWFALSFLFVVLTAAMPPAIAATAPVMLVLLYREYRLSRRRVLILGGMLLLFIVLIAAVPSFRSVISGYATYIRESTQATIAVTAHGVPWAWGFAQIDVPNISMQPWAWEILRFSWILVLFVFVPFVITGVAHQFRARSFTPSPSLFFPAVSTMFFFALVNYTLNRIDSGAYSRTGHVSLLALTLLLPVTVLLTYQRHIRRRVLITVFFLIVTISGNCLEAANIAKFSSNAAAVIDVQNTMDRLTAQMKAVPAMGRALATDSQTNDILLLDRTLKEFLKPSETYADLTNRPAYYFYLDKELPYKYSSILTMASTETQLRAVADIRKQDVPVALAFDSFEAVQWLHRSLRSYNLYRYFTLNYVPVFRNGYILMVKPERRPADGPSSEEQLFMLDTAFFPGDLEKIPAEWGRSIDILKNKMTDVGTISSAETSQTNDVRAAGHGVFTVTGPTPIVSYDISSRNVGGRDAGMIVFDFTCGSPIRQNGPFMYIAWIDDDHQAPQATMQLSLQPNNSGTVIIPIDTAPRWLLARRIEQLQISVESGACRTLSISDIKLCRRNYLPE